jgi:transcriptional regulator with XRE-family HTH domain
MTLIARGELDAATLGVRLRTLRERAGLTQTEVAEYISLGRTSLTNIEGGRQALSLRALVEIAAALGYVVDLHLVKPRR